MKHLLLIGFITGLSMTLVNFLFGSIADAIFPSLVSEYTNPVFRPWSDPLMLLYFLVPFYSAILLAYIWDKSNVLFRATSLGQKGIQFGFFYFIVVTIPGMLMTLSSFRVSFLMVMVWTIGGLLQGITAGLLFARFLRDKKAEGKKPAILTS